MSKQTKQDSKTTPEEAPQQLTKECGLVMPISSCDGCSESHWLDVKSIVLEALDSIGFSAELVSHARESGFIHKRIIENLYRKPIVICDVSGKNPNVMFELGLRLAFDKPTIIIKDDQTSYSFDTSPIEHLEYPRDLRYNRIHLFKKELAAKVEATLKRANEDNKYTPFLGHFGSFKVAEIAMEVVPEHQLLIEEMREMRVALDGLKSNPSRPTILKKNPGVLDGINSEAWKQKNVEHLINSLIHELKFRFGRGDSIRTFTNEEFDEFVLSQVKTYGGLFSYEEMKSYAREALSIMTR